MQQPFIREDILQRLARVACAYEFETERFLNHIMTVALDELEGREDDYTVCIPVQSEASQQDEAMPQTPHTCTLGGLIGDCLFALEALLTSPDLTLDCLEQATHDAIEVARETLHTVQKALAAHDGQQEVS